MVKRNSAFKAALLPDKRTLPTLRQTLRRIHLTIIACAFILTGVSLSALSLLALKNYAASNLELVASSVSISARGVLMQNNASGAKEILSSLGQRGLFAEGIIGDRHGSIAQWQKATPSHTRSLDRVLGRWLFPDPVRVPVTHHGKPLGFIQITGDAENISHYLRLAGIWLLGCLLTMALMAWWFSRRMHHGIVSTLQNIAAVAHDVRIRRAFSQRVPSAPIAELNKLSNDFNSLLDELQVWQHHWQNENDLLAHQAQHDAMTGLPNRAAFERELNLRFAKPVSRLRLALMFIDGDRFKRINDTWGHAVGDEVIIEMARRLRNALRTGDMVARLGGDEFAILLADIDDEEQVSSIAQKILRAMDEPIQLPNDLALQQSLSIGVALGRDFATPQSLLMQADAAMYHVKEMGGGWYLSSACWESPATASHYDARNAVGAVK